MLPPKRHFSSNFAFFDSQWKNGLTDKTLWAKQLHTLVLGFWKGINEWWYTKTDGFAWSSFSFEKFLEVIYCQNPVFNFLDSVNCLFVWAFFVRLKNLNFCYLTVHSGSWRQWLINVTSSPLSFTNSFFKTETLNIASDSVSPEALSIHTCTETPMIGWYWKLIVMGKLKYFYWINLHAALTEEHLVFESF